MMKTGFVVLTFLMAFSGRIGAQSYTNTYPKAMCKIAEKWVKKGEWKNGFTKAVPADNVNLVEFYLQYHRNPKEWQALFAWLEQNDLQTVPAGRIPIEGTDLTVSVEDGDNWCSEQDLKDGKGSESHLQKIDFMYVVSGTEGFARLDHETSVPKNEYKPDRYEYTFDASKLERFNSVPGTFNIMFPCDWHIAKIKTREQNQRLRVLVIKVNYKP